jgi:hypothetical protein
VFYPGGVGGQKNHEVRLARTAGALWPRSAQPPEHLRREVRRHCWIAGDVNHPGPKPGLIIEWRRRESGLWEARVVYLQSWDPDEPVMVEKWVGEYDIRPA